MNEREFRTKIRQVQQKQAEQEKKINMILDHLDLSDAIYSVASEIISPEKLREIESGEVKKPRGRPRAAA